MLRFSKAIVRSWRYWQQFVPDPVAALAAGEGEGSADFFASRPRPAPSTASRQDRRRNRRKAWRAVIAARLAA